MKPLVGNDTHILMPNKIENGVKDENKHYVLNIENLSHTFDKGTEHEYKIFDNFH